MQLIKSTVQLKSMQLLTIAHSLFYIVCAVISFILSLATVQSKSFLPSLLF